MRRDAAASGRGHEYKALQKEYAPFLPSLARRPAAPRVPSLQPKFATANDKIPTVIFFISAKGRLISEACATHAVPGHGDAAATRIHCHAVVL